jgi:fatty acid desaturase
MFSFEPNGFYNTLRQRVTQHFEHKTGHKINRGDVKANLDWMNTTFWLWVVFLCSQYQMLFGVHWLMRSMFGLTIGISLMGLAFNVLHDASHYGVSSNAKINQLLSLLHTILRM